MSTHSQLPYLDHLTNTPRKLGTSLTTVAHDLRLQAALFQDTVIHENLDRSEGGSLKSGYRIHRRPPTETIRYVQHILVLVARGKNGSEIIE